MSRVVCAACQDEGRDGCFQCGLLPLPADNPTVFDLQSTRQMCARATSGPWRQGSVERDRIFVPHPDGLGTERVILRMNEHFAHVDDAAFIAHARDALPAACTRVEELMCAVATSVLEKAKYQERITALESLLTELVDEVVEPVLIEQGIFGEARVNELLRILRERIEP